MARKILIAASNHWLSPIQVGDHHLARCFLDDGWNVGFLSSPLSPFHLLGAERDDYRQRLPVWRNGGQYFEGGRLWSYVPGALAVPRRHAPFNGTWLLRNWHRLTLPQLRRRLHMTGFDAVDVLHIRDVRFGFLLDIVNHQRSVFRLADNDRGFSHLSAAYHAELNRVAKRVSHFYYTARSLEPEVARLAPASAMYLQNGVSVARFAQDGLARPADLCEITQPIALYVGSIDAWFDFDLLRYAATKLPAIAFVIIGPPRLAHERLAGLDNVHILGRRPHDSIPAYLRAASVGLVPFDVCRHPTLVDAINPIKLYEYLAAGLPTVAVSWEELRRIAPPVSLTTTADAFVEAIAQNVERPPDRAVLQAFARQYDWHTVYGELCRFLEV